jgi:hypothetical protein
MAQSSLSRHLNLAHWKGPEMLKKSLIVSAFAIASMGAFAQAPAGTEMPAAAPAAAPANAPAANTVAREKMHKKVAANHKGKGAHHKAAHAKVKSHRGAHRAHAANSAIKP